MFLHMTITGIKIAADTAAKRHIVRDYQAVIDNFSFKGQQYRVDVDGEIGANDFLNRTDQPKHGISLCRFFSRQKHSVFFQITNHEKLPSNAVLPTRHESKIHGRKFCGILSNKCLAQGVICPQCIAERNSSRWLNAGVSPGARKGVNKMALLVDVIQQWKPNS